MIETCSTCKYGEAHLYDANLVICRNKNSCRWAETRPNNETACHSWEEKQPKADPVNHPSHYADKSIEVIDYIRDTMSHEHIIGYFWGNIIKYISRWPKKGGAEDLKKARVYLDWLIEEVEGKE